MIKNTDLANMALTLTEESLSGNTILYTEKDCQAYMEYIFHNCGINIDYKGSNDMFRNACVWTGTIDEAKKLGYLKPGVALFIVEHNGGEPFRYQDGLGNASHVGMYIGNTGLMDVDKNGKARSCDAVHSSLTMGRVAGTTLKNGWTHVGLWKNVDYGVNVGGNNMNYDNSVDMGEAVAAEYAIVHTPNGGYLNCRTKMSASSGLVPKIPHINYGETVEVNYYQGDWAHITYKGHDGFVKAEFLSPVTNREGAEAVEIQNQNMDAPSVNVTGVLAYIDEIRKLLGLVEEKLVGE